MHYSKLQKHNSKQYAVLVSLGNGFPGSFEFASGPEIALGFHSAMSEGIFQAYTIPT